jgi:EAL domain-containing protein (putative c-di-GMP-specific phosphodiesterase class I)/ActR/RegA family two-component response regulator
MELTSKKSGKNQEKLRILVLDDEPFILKLISRLLEIQGYTSVKTCSSAAFALECVAQKSAPIDIIIFDLNMPEMDGLEFVRGLVTRQYSGSLILVSGADERVLRAAEELIKAHAIPMLGHLRKPFLADRLAELLDKGANRLEVRKETKSVRSVDSLAAGISNNELINFYQPKVNIETGKVVGFETLVRWNHPVEGFVLPADFIGVAEDNCLIDALTRHVTVAAFRQAKEWAENGFELDLAINVSMDNLTQLDFPDFFSEQSEKFGVPPKFIVIEVTESRLMRDPRIPLEVLTRLRLKGFRLSIDDFGTGHSSLSQLQTLPFEELKVDRGFVHHAWRDTTTLAIYQASIDLAKRLSMSVVAEGVEDELDWNFVKRTKCGFAQGYFISRPMPSDFVLPWLERWATRWQTKLHAPIQLD